MANHSEIVVRNVDTVKTIMASVRALKKKWHRRPYTFTIRAPNMDTIATAVMAAGLLGSDPSSAANNWHIRNVSNESVVSEVKKSHVDTQVAFSFSGNLPDTHEQTQRYIGGREEYEEIEARVKDGRLPSCWYISNINGSRTLSGSLKACITRLQKSHTRGEKMHMGAAGSATRVLYAMAAKAIELETHVISEMTIHNSKRQVADVIRDVTFVHIVLQPAVSAGPSFEGNASVDDVVDIENAVKCIQALRVDDVGDSLE